MVKISHALHVIVDYAWLYGVLEAKSKNWFLEDAADRGRPQLETSLDRAAVHRITRCYSDAGGCHPLLGVVGIAQRDGGPQRPAMAHQ